MTIHAAAFREVRLDRVSRTFGPLNALRDVTLTIRQGEFIALLGPSGCGKSTTLHCIAGLLPATGGGIWLDERRIDTLRSEAARVRHGVSELRAVSAHDGAAQYRLRPDDARGEARGNDAAGRRGD